MAKKLYVGNLSYDMSQDDLRTIFEEFGTVDSAQVIMDRETGRSKGFGFVEMSNEDEAQAAISAQRQAGVWTHLDRERSPSSRGPWRRRRWSRGWRWSRRLWRRRRRRSRRLRRRWRIWRRWRRTAVLSRPWLSKPLFAESIQFRDALAACRQCPSRIRWRYRRC